MRALIIAWSATGVFLLGLIIWAAISYDAPEDSAPQTASIEDNFPDLNDMAEDAPVTSIEDRAAQQAGDDNGGFRDEEVIAADTNRDDAVTRPDFGDPVPDIAPDSVSNIVEQQNNIYITTIAAPDPTLLEQSPHGDIPVIVDQKQPWQVYSRDFDRPGDRPRISIIIVDMGLSESATQNSINQLPADVTLAFSPYGQDLPRWAQEARQTGHETLLMVPMEPIDFPVNDPGPHTIMSGISARENLDRLYYVMSRMQGYVGLVNDMGSKVTADPEVLSPIMQDLQRRGLIFVDARTSRLSVAATSAREFGVPRAQNDRYIDNDVSAAQIDRYLRELENIALRSGNAVGIGRPFPVTIERLIAWEATLAERGIELAPITAISNRQTVR